MNLIPPKRHDHPLDAWAGPGWYQVKLGDLVTIGGAYGKVIGLRVTDKFHFLDHIGNSLCGGLRVNTLIPGPAPDRSRFKKLYCENKPCGHWVCKECERLLSKKRIASAEAVIKIETLNGRRAERRSSAAKRSWVTRRTRELS